MRTAPIDAKTQCGFLDAFRVPYRLDASASANLVGPAGTVSWPDATTLQSVPLGSYRLDGVPLFVCLLGEAETAAALSDLGGKWRCELPIVDDDGLGKGGVWRSAKGDVHFPFDPDAARNSLIYEEYLRVTVSSVHHRVRSLTQEAYYRLRRLVPRSVQLAMRRRYLAAQNRIEFPNWPVETALHDLDSILLKSVEAVAGIPLPWLSAWPEPYSWAFVLTHDVEGADGYARLGAVLERELERGLRSACFFVPERDYHVETSRLAELREQGFEIGLHGLRHDGRDLSAGSFEQRLPAMLGYAEAWAVEGFRSPATHRDRGRLAQLGVDYDTSYSDVARFEPQPGGACTWLPYFLDSLVELPITMPMDHLVFELLGHTSDELWAEKGSVLRDNGGMALMLTHPDYLLDDVRLDVYSSLLDRWADDETAWRALPRDVASWWRLRAASTLRQDSGGWHTDGPAAARARVMTGAPSRPVHSGMGQ